MTSLPRLGSLCTKTSWAVIPINYIILLCFISLKVVYGCLFLLFSFPYEHGRSLACLLCASPPFVLYKRRENIEGQNCDQQKIIRKWTSSVLVHVFTARYNRRTCRKKHRQWPRARWNWPEHWFSLLVSWKICPWSVLFSCMFYASQSSFAITWRENRWTFYYGLKTSSLNKGFPCTCTFIRWWNYVPDRCYSATCFNPNSHHLPLHGNRELNSCLLVCCFI